MASVKSLEGMLIRQRRHFVSVALSATSLWTISFANNARSVRALSTSPKPFHMDKFTATQKRNFQDMTQPPQAPSHPWCCTSRIDPQKKTPVVVPIAGDAPFNGGNDSNNDGSNPPFRFDQGTTTWLDITSSADWMEFIEISEQRGNDEGGAGAYDTMRCDLIIQHRTTNAQRETTFYNGKWNIWGEEYHLRRLQNSFSSLLCVHQTSSPPTIVHAKLADDAVQTALKESDMLLKAMLEEAQESVLLKERAEAKSEAASKADTLIQLIKLTLLWSLPQSNADHGQSHDRIVVRGHACSSGNLLCVHRPIEPIIVTVAALGHTADHANPHDAAIDKSLPTRFQSPQSKVASWCKQRKKMDNPETYKPPAVGEVLMVRPINGKGADAGHDTPFSSLELLEGLSSNVFVIYKDGTFRTSNDGVLYGYVRKLVLDNAESCGLRLDPRPIRLQDALDGLWAECFITSSSRLIFPISRMLMPSREDTCLGESERPSCEIAGFDEFWHDPVLTAATNGDGGVGRGQSGKPQKWQLLLNSILSDAGYVHCDRGVHSKK